MKTLTYRLTGPDEAPVLLFLHGFMGAADDWTTVMEALEAHYRCLCVDLPGHGGSTSFKEEDYTMAGCARLLGDLLDRLAVARCAVIGYSMGGRLALYLGLHAPERYRRLVLESASPGLETEAERLARRGMDEVRAVRLETEDFDIFLNEWYRQPLFRSLTRQEGLREQMIAARRRNDPRELARVLRGMGTGQQPSLWERVAALEVSTLAVAGALDGKYVEVAERMAVLSEHVRAVVLPNAGHNVHAEYPKPYVDLLREFLKYLP